MFSPGEAILAGPLPMRLLTTRNSFTRIHEQKANVQLRVLFLYGHHLPLTFAVEQALSFNYNAVSEDEVWIVRTIEDVLNL